MARARKEAADNARYQAEMADYSYMVAVINERYTTAAAAPRKDNAGRPPPMKEPTRGQLLREALRQAKDELKAFEGESISKEQEKESDTCALLRSVIQYQGTRRKT